MKDLEETTKQEKEEANYWQEQSLCYTINWLKDEARD